MLGLGRPNTDLILVNKAGRPVRREGPKWEPERLEKDTLFILGSRANKVSWKKSYDYNTNVFEGSWIWPNPRPTVYQAPRTLQILRRPN